MTEAFDSPATLTAKYLFGLAGTGLCSFLIVQILFDIELNQFKRSVAPEVEKNLSELTLSSSNSHSGDADDEDDTSGNMNNIHNQNLNQSVIKKSMSNDSSGNRSEDSYVRKKRIHKETKIGIFFNVALVTFVNYLLLVYLPSGIASSLIAMTLLSTILLRAQLIEDLRRKRMDRISTIFSLLIFMAAFLSLSTYATLGKQEGGVYEGPARIVGYDVTNYNNEDQTALRTDLEVEWGGTWGCPDTPQKQCHAYVSGALCEVKEDRKRGRARDRDLKKESDAETTKEYYKEVETYQKEFVEDEKDAVEDVAEEKDLYYVEILQETEDYLQDASNTTETDIDSVENNITETASNITNDVAVADKEAANGTVSVEVVEQEDTDVTTLEEEVADLEKKVQELEEQNIEEEEVVEITAGDAEYYAVAAEEATNTTLELETENEELAGNEEYYKEVASEVEEENEGLVDANEDIAEENEILEDEVEEVVDYYQDKPTTEEVITVAYYPVNGSNPDGEYYVSVTETEIDVPAGENQNGAYSNSQNMEFDDELMVDDDGYSDYSFEDDFYEDEYWSYDWGTAWGDYACNDLFDTDLEGDTYDETTAPGDDNWPYVTIYGSCNSCKAFLVDYYSTEHFDKIKKYQAHAFTYATFGFVSLVITGALMLKQWLRPAEENQIDLLMSDGGQFV